jgi:2-polyprenyl-6-methoxyphenol hydroxylase-like FAD-dependent oxidoreductase
LVSWQSSSAEQGEDAVPLQGCNVVVAGGGIGGMTAALLLGSAGASVTLLERVAEPAAVGAGILLQPNGLAVLYALGLGEELQRAAWRTPPAAIRDPTGSSLLELPLPDFGRGLDHALVLRRSHLYGVLLAAVHAHPAITVRLGTQVRSASPDGTVRACHQGVEAQLTADLVVGADGEASTVRACGDFGAVARATGACYVRALVPGASYELAWGEYWTPLGLLGGAPLGDGSTYLYLDAAALPVARALAERDLDGFRRLWAAALPLAAPVLDRLGSVDALLVNQVVRVDCRRWAEVGWCWWATPRTPWRPISGMGPTARSWTRWCWPLSWPLLSRPSRRWGATRPAGGRLSAGCRTPPIGSPGSAGSPMRSCDGVATRRCGALAGLPPAPGGSNACSRKTPSGCMRPPGRFTSWEGHRP